MTAPKPGSRKSKPSAEAAVDVSLANDQLLSTRQAAALVGLTPKTLRQLRCDKAGPRCLKLGASKQARTVYRRTDLERWIASNATVIGGR